MENHGRELSNTGVYGVDDMCRIPLGRSNGARLNAPADISSGVRRAQSQIEKALEHHGQAIIAFGQRLESAGVLRAAPPQAAATQGQSPQHGSALACELDRLAERLSLMTAALDELNGRLDI